MRRLILILAVSVLVMAACGGGDDDGKRTAVPSPTARPVTSPLPPTETPPPSPTPLPTPSTDSDPLTRALLRVVHASPDLPAVDLYLGGARIGQGFGQGAYHSAPLAYGAGTYLLRATRPGENPSVVTPLLSQEITLEPGQSTVVVLAGPQDTLQAIVFQEDLSPLQDQQARIVAVHAVPQGAAFDLQENNRNLVEELSFGSVGAPFETASGSHTFGFASGPQTLAQVDMSLAGRSAYTLVLMGDEGGGNFRAVYFRSPTTDVTQVRITHASPDLPAIDAYLSDHLLAANLAFSDDTDWDTLRSATYQLRLLPAGDPEATPLFNQRITLNANKNIHLVLLNEASRLRAAQIEEDLTPTAEDAVRFTFVNAAIGTTQMGISTLSGALPGISSVPFGTGTRPAEVGSGVMQFMFQAIEGTESREIDMIDERDWLAGHAYGIVVTAFGDTPPIVYETETGTSGIAQIESDSPDHPAIGSPPAANFSIRVVHALPTNRPLDIAFDEAAVFDSVQPGSATAYHVFESQPEQMTVRDTISDELLLETHLNLSHPATLTLFIYDDDGQTRYALARDDTVLVTSTQARLRVLHAAANKPTLWVTRQEPVTTPSEPETNPEPLPPTPVPEVPLADPAEFGAPTQPGIIPTGTYDIRIFELESNILVRSLTGATIEPGRFYDLIILPDASGLSINPLLIEYEN